MEVASAFGTTGLSLGITDDLTTVGKLMIALLMFIGRIGMLYTLMIFVPKETRDLGYEYPSEKLLLDKNKASQVRGFVFYFFMCVTSLL